MFIKVLEKVNFLREQCEEENPFFLALFETWTKDGTIKAENAIDGYEHLASHLKNRKGGGVIYIREDIIHNFLASVTKC